MKTITLSLFALVIAGAVGLQAVGLVPVQNTNTPEATLMTLVTNCNAEEFSQAVTAYRASVSTQEWTQLKGTLETMVKALIEHKVQAGGWDPIFDRRQKRLGRPIRREDMVYPYMGFLTVTLAAASLMTGLAGVATAAIGLIPFKVYKGVGAGVVVISVFNYAQRIQAGITSAFCFTACAVSMYGLKKRIDYVQKLSIDIVQLDTILNIVNQA